MNQKYKLNKIYFTQKGKALKQNQKVFDIINYCLNKTDSFISKNNNEMILRYMRKIRINCESMFDNTINSILNNEIDMSILKNIYIDLSSLSCYNQINDNSSQMIHYMMILFFDFISLREIFHRYFQLSDCFNIYSIEGLHIYTIYSRLKNIVFLFFGPILSFR